MASNLISKNVETQVEMLIENVRQINIMVADFQPQTQGVLDQKLQKIVSDLHEVSKLKDDLRGVRIPLEVFKSIDQGCNPQLYTKDCLSKAMTKNEEAKGKIDGYRKLKANVLHELSQQFPRESKRYRTFRDIEDDE